jgi:hypothetical protein
VNGTFCAAELTEDGHDMVASMSATSVKVWVALAADMVNVLLCVA